MNHSPSSTQVTELVNDETLAPLWDELRYAKDQRGKFTEIINRLLATAPSRAAASAQTTAFDGDSEVTRKAFREYDAEYPVSRRSHWQIWRDAIAYAVKSGIATPPSPNAHTIGEDAANVAIGEREHPAWEHELKTDPEVFSAVLDGSKTHEIRFNDRDFKIGDTLLLRETRYTGQEMRGPEPRPLEYTGRETTRVVSHVLEGYGLKPGWVILSFARAALNAPPPDSTCFTLDKLAALDNERKAFENFASDYTKFPERYNDIPAWLAWKARSALTAEKVADAAISACALMIKGTCMTKSQDEWTKSIEERIRFMLKGTRK